MIGGLGNKSTCRDHLNCNIAEISQNNGKSPGDLRRLAVTQTLVKSHQLTLVKNSQKRKRIIITVIVITSVVDDLKRDEGKMRSEA